MTSVFIAAMTMEELAEYVVTLDGWHWMPGMYGTYAGVPCTCQKSHLQHSVRLIDLDALGGCMSRHRMGVCSYDATQGHFKPDLTDPATLGCLLAMVRAKHGKHCHARYYPDLGWFVDPGTHGPPIAYESVRIGYTKTPIYVGFKEEVRALVAALAAEVK